MKSSMLAVAKYRFARDIGSNGVELIDHVLSLNPCDETLLEILSCCEFVIRANSTLDGFKCSIAERWICEKKFVPNPEQVASALSQLKACVELGSSSFRSWIEQLESLSITKPSVGKRGFKSIGKQAVRKLFADESVGNVTFQNNLLELSVWGKLTMEKAVEVSYYPEMDRLVLSFDECDPTIDDSLVLQVLLLSFRESLTCVKFDRGGPKLDADRDPSKVLRVILDEICQLTKLEHFLCEKMYVDDDIATGICNIPSLTFFAAREKDQVHVSNEIIKVIIGNPTLSGVVIESQMLGRKEGESLREARPMMNIQFPGFTHGFGT